MSEKRRRPALGHAVALVGVAIGALVAACDARVPTELREAIDEVIASDPGEAADAGRADQPGESTLARWFDSDTAPLVFVDDVRIDTREDLPESVRQWVEGGLRDDDLVAHVETVRGTQILGGGKKAANGAVFIYTGPDEPDRDPRAVPADPPNAPMPRVVQARSASPPMPLIFVNGERVPTPDAPRNLTPYQFGQALVTEAFQDLAALDIESLEIIKGPAATVLFGEGAAGGVIRIVTKDSGTGR